MTHRIILVGCGNMGHAMLAGWLKSGKLAAGQVAVVEPNAGLRERAAALKVDVFESGDALPADDRPELIVLAVKPQVIKGVTEHYLRWSKSATTFLSVAAGTTVATFEAILGDATPIIRVMPNTPAAIGKGMLVMYSTPRVRQETREFVEQLLETSGRVATIADETLMDAVTAVSGSGPAYIFHFIECMTAAAEKTGLPADIAKLLAMQTVFGAASLAAESGEEPRVLREQVTSPNGTTAAALGVLMGGDRLKDLLADAVDAAHKRSIELGRG